MRAADRAAAADESGWQMVVGNPFFSAGRGEDWREEERDERGDGMRL